MHVHLPTKKEKRGESQEYQGRIKGEGAGGAHPPPLR